MGLPRRAGRSAEAGAVTAEAALTIPLLTALCVGLLWVLALGAAQVSTVDAAREAARMLARGESHAEATTVALRSAPGGASVRVEESDGVVRVTVRARIAPPGGLFSRAGAQVSSTAVAALEEPR